MTGTNENYPFHVLPSHRRRPGLGLLLSALGWGPLLLGIFLSTFLFSPFLVSILRREPPDMGRHIMGMAVMSLYLITLLLSFPLLMRLVKRGRGMRRLDAINLLARDHRPPVLYLRPFDDDDLPDLTLPSYSLSPRSIFPQTYEMKLCRVLNALGPVITIGRPGEQVPELGAARLYVSNQEWQLAVEYFFPRAAAVVINVGASEGVLWEATNALGKVNPGRLLYFFPFVLEREKRHSWLIYRKMREGYGFSTEVVRKMDAERQRRYQVFRQRLQAALPVRLPLSLGEACFLSFTEGGEPRVLESRRPTMARIFAGYASQTQIDLKRTLEPFLSKRSSGRLN